MLVLHLLFLTESTSPLISPSVSAPSTCHPAAAAIARLLSDRSGSLPLLQRAAKQQEASMWTAGWRRPWGFSQCSPTLSHLIFVSFPLLRFCRPCSSPSLSFCPIKSLFCVLLLLRSQTLELIISCAFPPRHPSSPFHPVNSSANLPALFIYLFFSTLLQFLLRTSSLLLPLSQAGPRRSAAKSLIATKMRQRCYVGFVALACKS